MVETLIELELRPEDLPIRRCACCGAAPSLWELDRDGVVTKMVNCNTEELYPGAEGRPITETCPLYTPSFAFNRATRREAINYWNQFNDRLEQLRSKE